MVNVRGEHRTDIERMMFKALGSTHYYFVMHYPIRCKYGYVVDFFLPEYNIVVECDGTWCHDKEHDRKRDAFLKKKGYKTLRFNDKEIYDDINSCVTKIVMEVKKQHGEN